MIGQRVMIHNLRPGPTWIPGTIVGRNGPLSYVVQVKGEQVWKRHIEHLREMGDTPVSDMLNKNTWGVKKCGANQKQHCKQAGATKKFDIS